MGLASIIAIALAVSLLGVLSTMMELTPNTLAQEQKAPTFVIVEGKNGTLAFASWQVPISKIADSLDKVISKGAVSIPGSSINTTLSTKLQMSGFITMIDKNGHATSIPISDKAAITKAITPSDVTGILCSDKTGRCFPVHIPE